MIEVIWTGQHSTIPGYGEVKDGVKKTLPSDMAESFKKQGLCKFVIKKKLKSNEEETK